MLLKLCSLVTIKLFPLVEGDDSQTYNESEIQRLELHFDTVIEDWISEVYGIQGML